MSKRSYKKPLEWVHGAINTTNDTVTNFRIELGLKDDEVAEIHKIDSSINHGNVPDAANDQLELYEMLSMDPNVIADPSVAVNHEDLEIFFDDSYQTQQEVGGASTATLVNSHNKISDFENPILVGTDIGMVAKGDAAVACEFWTRIYFSRRKANVMELNQILLKRR
jgi:hypothetical protein